MRCEELELTGHPQDGVEEGDLRADCSKEEEKKSKGYGIICYCVGIGREREMY